MAVAATIDEHPGVRDDIHKGMRAASTTDVDPWRSGLSGESLPLNQWLARAGTAADPACGSGGCKQMAVGAGAARYSGTSGGANTTMISRSSVILVK
jgi:hypothetical protein